MNTSLPLTPSRPISEHSENSAGIPSRAHDDELWHRLRQFNLDLPLVGLTFSERAAKENAWSIGYTRRVIEEYRRFVFLACRTDHVVCPSEDVDQIWHMHLTYTRSYWDELCKEVLRSPLHHGPTEGGSEEREKYYRLYERTLASYRTWFGEEPPTDIWPSADIRFGEDLHHVRVNTSKHWIIPRPKWSRVAIRGASAGILLPLVGLAANPFNWTGPQFLALYFGLLVIAVVVSLLLRRWLLNQSEKFQYQYQPENSDEIGHLEAAWLQGGDERTISCALVDLAQSEEIALEGSVITRGKNINHGENPDAKKDRHRITNLILGSISSSTVGKTWNTICREANVGLVAMRQELEEKGLVTTSAQRASIAAYSAFLVGGVALLGVGKIVVGVQRDRPVGILVLGEIAAVVCLIALIKAIPRLTQSGKQLLARLQREIKENPDSFGSIPNDQATSTQDAATSDPALLWSAALLGTGVLAATPLADYSTFLDSQISAQQRNAGSGGCGGTGCGGDGGGCGGCGGCGG